MRVVNDPEHGGAALAVAERLFAAIAAGEVEAVREVYAPDASIWHNYDGATQTVDENVRVLAWVVAHVKQLRYTDVRREATESGFVQQHVLRGTAPSGAEIAIPACIVCRVEGGRITRLDEYFDGSQLTPLLAG
jgi:ketosteroid isomerase-like protein